MDVRRQLSAVADQTTATTIKIWGFGVGGALAGLVKAGERLGNPAYIDHVADLVAPSLASPPDPTDHLISVEALQTLAAARPDLNIDDACERWTSAVLNAPRPRPSLPRVHRPDLAPWSSTIWVDCMHTDGPGLAALGYTDEAVQYIDDYATVLQRDDGLFQHGYDVETERGNGVAWGRGQGWALLGLVETLRLVDDDGLQRRLRRLAEALASYEHDGRWHTIVDDAAAPIEHSVAAYVADGLGRAIDLGLVERSFVQVVDRAWAATLAALDDGGLLVSEATPVGDPAGYTPRSVGVFAWGQAPVLHVLSTRLDRERVT